MMRCPQHGRFNALHAISSFALEKFSGQVWAAYLYDNHGLPDRLLHRTFGFGAAKQGRI